MSVWHTSLVLPAVLLVAGAAGAADLSKIDRTINKEPSYQGKPKYCLLVFGPEARTRVWLAQDDEAVYVDRNGNGDLTEAGERVLAKQSQGGMRSFDLGEVRDGDLTHKELSVMQFAVTQEQVGDPAEFKRIASQGPGQWTWWVRVDAERPAGLKDGLPQRVKYVANGDGLGYLLFADRPQDAPVIHFNGPWTLGLQDVKQRLEIGQKSNLQIGVGTPGVGPGTFSFVLYPGLIPNSAYPAAEIVFPPRSPGETPPKERFTLKSRC